MNEDNIMDEKWDKKGRIMAAAEEIMSLKGLSESTISEISRTAGVADSIIYQYFRGKEDLLFSIPAERMKEVLTLLEEALQGILGAESRLGKMMWFHLQYNDNHPGYSRILLFECRSSKDFYQTPAYQMVRKYAGVLLGIVEQGIQDRVFRSDINSRLVRDIVLGTLNCETISCFAIGEIMESTSDFDDIVNLVLAMVTKKKEEVLSKPDRILLAAESLFAEKGFSKATIGEIAKLAKISEGSVYEYYENKEELLLSIPRKRFHQFLSDLPETFHIKNPLRKLRKFIKYHFLLFLENRAFLKVFLVQIEPSKRFYESKSYESYRDYFRVIEEIIEEGKNKGTFRPDINPRVFRNMFMGAFSHITLRWLLFDQENEIDKIDEINQLTDLLCSAVIR